jgi:coenzyme F420-reducing hydrogenase beta subunit
MIQIIDKSKCCGCEACVQVCPKHCINFTQDHEGFFYPVVDFETCIQCGLCEKVCPVLHPYDEHHPQEVLAAINKNEKVRMESSSGGVFTLLAEEIINQGGAVFGVRFDENWQAVFDYAETTEALANFKGSKYLQARVGNSFTKCKQLLEQGRKVLFSGTQCQIAGLLHFLRRPYPNLLTVDFICHGVPSPKVWQHYLGEAVQAGKQAIADIKFRDKRLGWKRFSFTLDYNEQNRCYNLTSPFTQNTYMNAFLANLILRPSCYSCPSKGGKSNSDITIADFWGIDQVNPEMFDDRGTSLVLIHTERGQQALNRQCLKWAKASYEDVIHFNPSWKEPAPCHPKRSAFFAAFDEQVNLTELIVMCLQLPLQTKAKHTIKCFFIHCKRFVKKIAGGVKL